MWQEDLTPDTYGRKHPDPKILAYGWLENGKPYEVGHTDPKVIEFLQSLSIGNRYRGFHDCDFCPSPPKDIPYKHSDYHMGNGDLRVEIDDLTFVAPALILHYIKDHGYKVPGVIQEGILKNEAKPGRYERYY